MENVKPLCTVVNRHCHRPYLYSSYTLLFILCIFSSSNFSTLLFVAILMNKGLHMQYMANVEKLKLKHSDHAA